MQPQNDLKVDAKCQLISDYVKKVCFRHLFSISIGSIIANVSGFQFCSFVSRFRLHFSMKHWNQSVKKVLEFKIGFVYIFVCEH